MAIVYLEPEDLTPAQQTRVLEFLNNAASATELADLIEFPNELDIGVKLGQRLLNARAQAGGAFTSLQQVAATPLIGPERFTEICAAALGLDPRGWSDNLNLILQQQPQFSQDYAQLQAQLENLAKLGEQVMLDLQCPTQPAWLGQPLDIRLYARDAAGRPLADRRITVEAGTGILETVYGLSIRRGKAVEVRTGADGSVRLSLHYTPVEPLTIDQQAALEAALALLDPTATSPHLLKEGFYQIAAAYQQERSESLRKALDIYAREAKARFFEQLNASNLGFQWPEEISVLRADYHPQETAAATARAVIAVRWKNWVGAWFEFLGEYLGTRAGLQQSFAKAKQRGAEGFRLVDDLIGEAHSFVAAQQGLAGQWLSQRVVKYAVHDFLAAEIGDLDGDTQRELFSHLEIASEQLTPANRGTLSAVNESRVQLTTKIDQISRIDIGLIDQLNVLQKDITAKAEAVAQAEQFVTEKTAAFNIKYDSVLNNIDTVRLELSEFSTQRNELTKTVNDVKADVENVKLDIVDIRTRTVGG